MFIPTHKLTIPLLNYHSFKKKKKRSLYLKNRSLNSFSITGSMVGIYGGALPGLGQASTLGYCHGSVSITSPAAAPSPVRMPCVETSERCASCTDPAFTVSGIPIRKFDLFAGSLKNGLRSIKRIICF